MGAVENLKARQVEFKAMIADTETPTGAKYGLCLAHNNISDVLKKMGEPLIEILKCDQYKPGA